VFPVRYGLDSYILFRIYSVFKGLLLLLILFCRVLYFVCVCFLSSIRAHFVTDP
jgi:hypothetical protein